MIIAQMSENEEQRLKELLDYEMLDTPDDQEYKDIVRLASHICNTPIALISLLDSCRQWFKAEVGLGMKETSRDISFCAHAIHQDEVMVVENTKKDKRFTNNPLVTGGPKIRFYAGAPLISPSGQKLGTLCVLDKEARTLTEEQTFALETLSRHVVQKFELRKKSDHLRNVYHQYLILQRELESRQKEYTKAQDSADVGFFELDVIQQVFKVSGGIFRLCGISGKKDFPLGELLEVIHPLDKADYLNTLKHSIQEAGHIDFEYRCINKDNQKEIFFRCTGEIIRNERGRALRVVGIKQNITDKKRAEEELKNQKLELEKVKQELDHFVSRVSHDLRAPISTILGLIDLILHYEQDKEKIKELLLLVKKSLDKQDSFIRDILHYSQNSRLGLEVEEIDFEKMLEEIFSQLSFAYPDHSVNVATTREVQQKELFVTDWNRLYVILTNVISNALKYQNPGAENNFVKVHVEVDQGQARITVSDSGMGIEEKHLGRIFEMFYRATDQAPGSGLGLYIVKESVSKLKGSVQLESEVRKGTRVTITLPNLKEVEERETR